MALILFQGGGTIKAIVKLRGGFCYPVNNLFFAMNPINLHDNKRKKMDHRIVVRNAEVGDISALIAIKGAGSEVIHLDRLRDAQNSSFRYLIMLIGQEVIGSACLVFRRPSYWSDGGDLEHLPQIVDLQIREAWRGQGYGTAFIRTIEQIAAVETKQIYLRVEPLENPRAYALYQKLGYQPLQSEPYLKTWEFTDSEGGMHSGKDWVVDMVKQL